MTASRTHPRQVLTPEVHRMTWRAPNFDTSQATSFSGKGAPTSASSPLRTLKASVPHTQWCYVLLKLQLRHDQEVFDKAYGYVKQYY
jgi:hypothetical protein